MAFLISQAGQSRIFNHERGKLLPGQHMGPADVPLVDEMFSGYPVKSEMTMSQWFISMERTSSRVASGEIQSSLSTNCM